MESLEQLLEELSEFKPVSAGLVQSAKTELNNHMVDYGKLKRIESEFDLVKHSAKDSSPKVLSLIEGSLFNKAHLEMISSNINMLEEENKVLKERALGLTAQIEAIKALKYKKTTQNEYEEIAANQDAEWKLCSTEQLRDLEIKDLAKSIFLNEMAPFNARDPNPCSTNDIARGAINIATVFFNEWEESLKGKT